MSHPSVHCSSAAQAFWLSLLDVAVLPDWYQHVQAIATDSGFSYKSIEKRLKAIRWHVEQNISTEVIAEWGAERTVSLWQTESNLNQGKQPGATANISHRVRREVRDNWVEMLKAVTGATGASTEDSLNAIAETFINSEPQEILAVLGRYLGVRE